MQYKNVIITGSGIYHPKHKMTNDHYINEYKKMGKDITDFLDKFGQKERYIIDNDHENSLTMAIEASKNAIKDAGISPEELDAIVFSSDTPEYLCPTNALIINQKINAKNAHIVYDLNSNCTGMLVAIDQISGYMKATKKIKYALVVGAVYESSVADKESKYIYPLSGDGAAAVILKYTEEDTERGILDSHYCTKSEYYPKVLSPQCGLTKSRLSTASEKEKKHVWIPFPFHFLAGCWGDAIRTFEKEHNFNANDIDHFFISQYSKQFISDIANELDLKDYESKFTYVGDKYGYTGTTSPIFALNEARKTKIINKNDLSIICSVAAGVSLCTLLYKF